MVLGLDNFDLVRKASFANLYIVYKDSCWSIEHATFHFMNDFQGLNILTSFLFVEAIQVALGKDIKIHFVLWTPAVQNATWPISNDLVVIA